MTRTPAALYHYINTKGRKARGVRRASVCASGFVVLRDSEPSEHEQQSALFRWAELMEAKHPELWLLHSCPNGSYKSRATAMKFKREGLKSGVPDISLPVARGGFHHLYIEMKRKRIRGSRVELRAGKMPSGEQLRWHSRLVLAGNQVAVAYGWEEARDIILEYLALPAKA